ncbi:MAG: hypothetical protein NTW72_05275 [Gemmatimonadetes bacterium]|nr:hypothetical protein [Gemmatimonadota bacterium]
MPQYSTDPTERAISKGLGGKLQLRQGDFITLCKTRFGGKQLKLRDALAKDMNRSTKHQGLSRAVKRWFTIGRPVRVSREYATAICSVLEVKERDLFEVEPATPTGRSHFAYADKLARRYGALCERLPQAGLPMLGIWEFDFLLTYNHWRAALVRSEESVLPSTKHAEDRVKGNLTGTRLALRSDDFANNLYRVLAILLADAKKAKPREAQWKALAGLLRQLCEALKPPEPVVAMDRAGDRAMAAVFPESHSSQQLPEESESSPNEARGGRTPDTATRVARKRR